MENVLFAFIPGGTELMVVLFIVLLFFGGKKLPELMRGMGKGIKEFNNARDTMENEIKEGMKEEPSKQIEGKTK